MQRPLTTEEFRKIYSKVPRLCVEVVIKTDEGVVLTFRTKFGWENKWHIPGGTVFMGERLEDAVHRVALDEVGAKVKIKELLGYIHYPSEEKERGFGWAVGVAFLCELDGEMKEISDGDKVGFFAKASNEIIDEQNTFLVEKGLIEK